MVRKAKKERMADTNMAHYKHKSCGAAEKIWLPYEFEGRSRRLKPHSYCVHCGVVKKYSKVPEDRLRAFL